MAWGVVRRVVQARAQGAGRQRVPLPMLGLVTGACHCVVREAARSSSLVLVVAE